MAGEIRQKFDIDALSRYIKQHVPAIELPIGVKQFGFGQSNPTYQLTTPDGSKFVMRKKPPGKLVSKTAHQVDREYRILHALEHTDVPVPKTYCLCEDDSVIGTAFYIMEFLDGRIIEDASLPDVSPEDRTEMWHDAIRTIGKLHRVDPVSVGLGDFGKHSQFYNRQIRTFKTISKAQAEARDAETHESVGNIPHFKDMVEFFSDADLQPKDRMSFVHGDYKIDNVVFHKTEPRVIGVLDWEMATIGHPLSDVCNVLNPYVFAAGSSDADKLMPDSPVSAFREDSRLQGLASQEQLLKWYAELAGWDPRAEIKWGQAFTCFRNTVIMQGIKARLYLRQASSAQAKMHADRVEPFAEMTWKMILDAKERAKKEKGRAKL